MAAEAVVGGSCRWPGPVLDRAAAADGVPGALAYLAREEEAAETAVVGIVLRDLRY